MDMNVYNVEAVHDMFVDFNNSENTGFPDVFEEETLDDIIDNLNDWD